MTQVMCHRCGITPGEIHTVNAEDYFTPTGNGNEILCTTCISMIAYTDRGSVDRSNLTALLVEINRAHSKTLARLRLAEDCASLFRDHLHGCVDTVRETDALTEWEHAAGVKPVPDGADDYPRAEDMA